MRGLWPDVRNVLAIQSRRPEKRSRTLPLTVQREAITEVIHVARSEFPTYLTTPMFPPPAILWRNQPIREIRGVCTSLDVIHLAGPSLKDASQRFPGATFVGKRTTFVPEDFARTLAKIGFCAAVYALGLGRFGQTPIRKVILGAEPCIGRWVGSWHGRLINQDESGIHAIKVMASGTVVHVFVRLFAQFGAPEYHVVLGPADPAFVESEEWPWPVADRSTVFVASTTDAWPFGRMPG